MLFDSTIRRELARSFGATLVVILTIVITMMLIRTLGLAAGGKIAPADVILLLGYFALGHLSTMLSLSLFIAIVVTLGRMYRDSEMAIWFSCGLGLSRFLRPVLRMAWPVLIVVGALLLLVLPWGNKSSAELRQRYEQRSDLSRVAPGVFQTSRDGSRVFFVDRASREGVDGHNVFILSKHQTVESVTSARNGHLESVATQRVLTLDHGQRNESDSTGGRRSLASFDEYRVVVDERATANNPVTQPRAMPTADLVRDFSARSQGELAWRFGLLLAACNLLLIGVGLSAHNPRRGGNWNLMFALLAFIAYFNLINLSQAWVGGGRFALGPTLALLHGGVLVIGVSLLWWRDHGAVRRWINWKPAA